MSPKGHLKKCNPHVAKIVEVGWDMGFVDYVNPRGTTCVIYYCVIANLVIEYEAFAMPLCAIQ